MTVADLTQKDVPPWGETTLSPAGVTVEDIDLERVDGDLFSLRFSRLLDDGDSSAPQLSGSQDASSKVVFARGTSDGIGYHSARATQNVVLDPSSDDSSATDGEGDASGDGSDGDGEDQPVAGSTSRVAFAVVLVAAITSSVLVVP